MHQVVVACTEHTDTDADQMARPCKHEQMHPRGRPVEMKQTCKIYYTSIDCRFQTSGQVNHSRDTAGCCIPFSTNTNTHTHTVHPKRKSKWKNLLRRSGLSSDRIEFVGVTNFRQMQMCRSVMERRKRDREKEKAGAHGIKTLFFASFKWATWNSVNGDRESIVSIGYMQNILCRPASSMRCKRAKRNAG